VISLACYELSLPADAFTLPYGSLWAALSDGALLLALLHRFLPAEVRPDLKEGFLAAESDDEKKANVALLEAALRTAAPALEGT